VRSVLSYSAQLWGPDAVTAVLAGNAHVWGVLSGCFAVQLQFLWAVCSTSGLSMPCAGGTRWLRGRRRCRFVDCGFARNRPCAPLAGQPRGAPTHPTQLGGPCEVGASQSPQARGPQARFNTRIRRPLAAAVSRGCVRVRAGDRARKGRLSCRALVRHPCERGSHRPRLGAAAGPDRRGQLAAAHGRSRPRRSRGRPARDGGRPGPRAALRA
jgi:hypothetical protein